MTCVVKDESVVQCASKDWRFSSVKDIRLSQGIQKQIVEIACMTLSKNFPTYPWIIPQTPNQQFMKEFLPFWVLGMPGVCSRGMLGFS